MADKRSRSSVPPKPPPPPSVMKSALGETPPPAVTAYVANPPAPLTNGGILEKPDKTSIPSKPKPPSKPLKVTRAFSSGSMTFGRIGKTRKKSKPNSIENVNPNDVEGATTPATNKVNEVNELLNGNNKEEEKDSLWKLPGIETACKMQGKLLKSRAISDSSLLDRKLPPVPDQESRELLVNRELPPLPPPEPDAAAQSTSASPLLSASPGTRDSELLGQSSKALSTSTSDNLGFIATYVNVQSPGNDKLPETQPNAEDCDLNASNFRPLPKTPDYDDELDGDVPTEQQNGIIEADQTNLDSRGKDNLTDTLNASQELTIDKAAKDRDGSSKSSLTPSDLPTMQQAEMNKELRDYTIGEIVNTYSYALPVCVKILQGYCSDTTEVNISTEDVYNIHSVQHMRKLMVKDEDGMTHRVSLEAPVKMGLVFNPKNDSDESLNGYSFKTVADMTSLPVLPKVVSATQRVNCGDEKNSVSEGEVFVVRQVQRSVFKGKKGLKMFSLLTNSIKVLSDDCPGNFSTKPSLVKMDLPDLLEKVADLFPSCCIIYPTTDNASHKADFPGISTVNSL